MKLEGTFAANPLKTSKKVVASSLLLSRTKNRCHKYLQQQQTDNIARTEIAANAQHLNFNRS
jgi:hypothetical protein